MFKFELVSPERVLLSENVAHVVLPAMEGDMGVLQGHAPFVTTLRPGTVTVLDENNRPSRRIYVRDGFAEFTNDTLNLLAEQAVNLDSASAGEEVAALLAAAEKDLAEASDDEKRFLASAAIEALKAA